MGVERTRRADAIARAGLTMILAGIAAIGVGAAGMTAAGATKPNPEHKVTLCHRTASRTNPYVQITVDVASVLGAHGHDGHNGPVFSAGLAKNVKWGDIIPPFDFGPGEQYAGQNLPAGAAILAGGCAVVTANTTTTSDTTTTGDTATTGDTTTTITGTTTTTDGTVSTLGHPNPNRPGDPGRPTGSLAFSGSRAAMLLWIGLVLVGSGAGLAIRRRNWAGATRR